MSKMSHLVFARKYRPQNFKQIVGQEHVTKALMNAIVRDRVPHALLFTGPRGVGKTTSARVLSKALNCTGRVLPKSATDLTQQDLYAAIEPCGSCPNCVDIARGSNLAVVEIDGASNNSVENVRQLIETLLTAPPPNITYKIYIIDEVHMLSVAAFNALLKTLEEPPPNTIFIFATTEPHKIPDTVISRCQQHDFRRFSLKNVREQLRYIVEAEGLHVEDEVLQLIAKKCFGGMRDASTLLERVVSFSDNTVSLKDASLILGVFDFEFYAQVIEDVVLGKRVECLSRVRDAFSSTIDIKGFFSDFVSSFRLIYLYALSKDKGDEALRTFLHVEEVSDSDTAILSSLVELAPPAHFLNLYDESRTIADTALKSQYPRYVLEVGLVKMCQLDKIIELSQLVSQLQAGNSFSHAPSITVREGGTSLSPRANSVGNAVDTSVKKKSEDLTEPSSEEPSVPSFAWSEFLSFVKKSGSITLETYLKKVAPKNISIDDSADRGSLHIIAPYFVSSALQDTDTMALLKKLLTQYARISVWEVTIEIHEEEKQEQSSSHANTSAQVLQRSLQKSSKMTHVPGSQESKSHQQKIVKVKKIEEEAKEDELVKHALSIFSGAVIEKITPVASKIKE